MLLLRALRLAPARVGWRARTTAVNVSAAKYVFEPEYAPSRKALVVGAKNAHDIRKSRVAADRLLVCTPDFLFDDDDMILASNTAESKFMLRKAKPDSVSCVLLHEPAVVDDDTVRLWARAMLPSDSRKRYVAVSHGDELEASVVIAPAGGQVVRLLRSYRLGDILWTAQTMQTLSLKTGETMANLLSLTYVDAYMGWHVLELKSHV